MTYKDQLEHRKNARKLAQHQNQQEQPAKLASRKKDLLAHLNRMAGFNAPPAPRSYQGRRLDRRKRVEEGERRLSCCAVFKLMQLLGWLCCGCQLTSFGSTYDRKPGRRLG